MTRPTLFTKTLLALLILANISHANTPSAQQNDDARKAQAEQWAMQRAAENKAKAEAERRAREQALQQPTKQQRHGDFYRQELTQDPKTGKYGVIDHQDNIIIDAIHDKLNEFTYVAFDDKPVYFAKKQGKYGIYDHQGGIILPFEYDNIGEIGELEQGILPLSKNGKWGMIKFATDRFQRIDFKKPYQVMVDFRLDYDFVHGFIDELSLVHKNDKYGFIDKTGKLVIGLDYDFALPFYAPILKIKDSTNPSINNEPIAFVAKKSGEKVHLGAIDKTGKVIIPLIYDNILSDPFDHLIIISKDGKMGVVGRTGSFVLPLVYDDIKLSPVCFSPFDLLSNNANQPRQCTIHTTKDGIKDEFIINY